MRRNRRGSITMVVSTSPTVRSIRKTNLAGSLESVDDVERGHGLALRVLSVGDRVANNVLEEDLSNEKTGQTRIR